MDNGVPKNKKCPMVCRSDRNVDKCKMKTDACLTSFTQAQYYTLLKMPGANKIFRRLQVTDLKILQAMNDNPMLSMCLTTLSEYDFGFGELQAIARTIVVPVRDGLGSPA